MELKTMDDRLNELNITVCKETKDILDALSKASGLSAGEVIDRMILAVSPSNTEKAYLLILDQILIATQRLNHEQFNEVILMVLKALEDAFAKDEPEEIVSTLKNIVEKLTVQKIKNSAEPKIHLHKVKSVLPLDDFVLEVAFIEGGTKRYDVKPLFGEIPYFSDLTENDIFSKVVVSPGGYGIIWNDDVDLSCDELWENGTIC